MDQARPPFSLHRGARRHLAFAIAFARVLSVILRPAERLPVLNCSSNASASPTVLPACPASPSPAEHASPHSLQSAFTIFSSHSSGALPPTVVLTASKR
jgi:hypothetical protein